MARYKLALALMLAATLVACGGTPTSPSTGTDGGVIATPNPTPTPTPTSGNTTLTVVTTGRTIPTAHLTLLPEKMVRIGSVPGTFQFGGVTAMGHHKLDIFDGTNTVEVEINFDGSIEPVPVVVPVVPTPTSTSGTITIDPAVAARGNAVASRFYAPGGDTIVRCDIAFASLGVVTYKTTLHELSHCLGAFHVTREGAVMYLANDRSGSLYLPEELEAFSQMFAGVPGSPCPTTTVFLAQMVCGDASAFANPGLRQTIARLNGPLTISADPGFEGVMSILQSAAANLAGKSAGYNIDIVAGTVTATASRAMSASGGRMTVIVD